MLAVLSDILVISLSTLHCPYLVATIAELERCRNIDTIHSPPPTPPQPPPHQQLTQPRERRGKLYRGWPRGGWSVWRSGLVFVLVLLVRLMFLCNVNNVEPSSWTREQAAWPGGQPCQPRTENDSRASGPVHPSPARPPPPSPRPVRGEQ